MLRRNRFPFSRHNENLQKQQGELHAKRNRQIVQKHLEHDCIGSLKTIEKLKIIMQNFRNRLELQSIRCKIETGILQRIGNVHRMNHTRTSKATSFGWIQGLEQHKNVGRMKTQNSWCKLLTKAGLCFTQIESNSWGRQRLKKTGSEKREI